MHINLDASPRAVTFAGGRKVISLVRDGTVSGRITGAILCGGGDWFVIDPAGVGHVDVRLAIATDSGETIDVAYDGKLVMPRGGWRRQAAGQTIPSSEAYFRTALKLIAPADGDYSWLNSIVAVGVGTIGPDWVDYTVFELK